MKLDSCIGSLDRSSTATTTNCDETERTIEKKVSISFPVTAGMLWAMLLGIRYGIRDQSVEIRTDGQIEI